MKVLKQSINVVKSFLVNNYIKYSYLYGIIVCFILSEAIINPIGEFSLNDDWAYSKTVINYLNNGDIEAPAWGGATFLTQLIWAVIFCKIFGFSFTILRLSSIILSLIGIIFFYKLISNYLQSKRLVSLSTIILCFNPIYFQQSNTFQTDIPYTTLSIICFYYFSLFYVRNNISNYIIAIVFSIFSILLKQTGISLGLTFALSYLVFRRINIKNLFIAFIPFFIQLSILLGYGIVKTKIDNLPGDAYDFLIPLFFDSIFYPNFDIIKKFGYYSLNTSLSLGLFIFPFVFPTALLIIKKIKLSNIHLLILCFVICLYSILIIIKIILRGQYLPFSGNIVYDLGLGPIIMTGIEQNQIPGLTGIGIYAWFALSLIGAVGFLSLLYFIVICIKENFHGHDINNEFPVILGVFSFIYSILYILPFLFVYSNIRFLIPTLPYLIILSISTMLILEKRFYSITNFNYGLSQIFFFPIILFSICATHDYLLFHRTKMDAIKFLTENQKIPIEKIDGGFEFNEWNFSHLYTWKMSNDPQKFGRFWPVIDDEYIVTVTEIDGYDLYKVFKYIKWLPPGEFNINVLKRSKIIKCL